jgi:hypothetical protein
VTVTPNVECKLGKKSTSIRVNYVDSETLPNFAKDGANRLILTWPGSAATASPMRQNGNGNGHNNGYNGNSSMNRGVNGYNDDAYSNGNGNGNGYSSNGNGYSNGNGNRTSSQGGHYTSSSKKVAPPGPPPPVPSRIQSINARVNGNTNGYHN